MELLFAADNVEFIKESENDSAFEARSTSKIFLSMLIDANELQTLRISRIL